VKRLMLVFNESFYSKFGTACELCFYCLSPSTLVMRPSAQHVTHRLSHHGVSQPSGLRASPHLACTGSSSAAPAGVMHLLVAAELLLVCVETRGGT
jgi:hypothetical protein